MDLQYHVFFNIEHTTKRFASKNSIGRFGHRCVDYSAAPKPKTLKSDFLNDSLVAINITKLAFEFRINRTFEYLR